MAELHIEVACATPRRQRIMTLKVAPGTTLREAVERSHIADEFPEVDVANAPLGIFGKKVARPEKTPVEDGQRIEIYRPLLIDPKQARSERAARAGGRQKMPTQTDNNGGVAGE